MNLQHVKTVLVIDNYDSFTYNLVHYLEGLNSKVIVVRNDDLRLRDVKYFQKILLSPGPGLPKEAALLKPIVKKYASTKSIFGVCLGMQAIAEVFGAKLIRLDTVYHGVSAKVNIVENDPLFKGLPVSFQVGRYHSWTVHPRLPKKLIATSFDENGQIMSLRHRTYDVRGVQYHPESILTPKGKKILKNWLNI